MSEPADNLLALFRSFGPDDSSFQAAEITAAREAAQRWPLFQALSPRKPEITPTLSAQERQRWSPQEQSGKGERKPALSLPSLSDKIASSLGKMSGRTAEAPMQNPIRRSEADTSPVAIRSQRSPPQMNTQAFRSAPFSVTPQAIQDLVSQESDAGLLGPQAGEQNAARRTAPVVAPAADSLAGVFSRLEGNLQICNKPIDKKSSSLNRLGKR